MKPREFDGKNVDINTFLVQFESCARFNGWSDLGKAAFFRNSLSGEAAQQLWNDGDSCDTRYEDLVECLRRRYAAVGQEESYRAELSALRRWQQYTLLNVYQNVKRLMVMAFPAEQSSCRTIVARDTFVSALNDTQLERRIREREPVDTEAAFSQAVKFEYIDKALERADDSDARPKACRRIHSDVVEDGLLEVKYEREQQKQELIELMTALEANLEQAEVWVGPPPPQPDQVGPRDLQNENECLCSDVEQLRPTAVISSRPVSATLGRRRRSKRTVKTRPFVPQLERIYRRRGVST
jgi:hypothetical protein